MLEGIEGIATAYTFYNKPHVALTTADPHVTK